MPRTHSTFDELYPAGSLQADQIDEIVRRTRLEVKELLEDGIVEDCDEDPLVLTDAVSGRKDSKILFLPPALFAGIYNGAGIPSETAIQTASGDGIFCPVVLSPGVTVRQVELLVSLTSAVVATIQLRKFAFNTTLTATTVWSTTKNTTPIELVDSGAISEVIASDAFYELKITGATGLICHGAKITYDSPTHLTTI